jgi:hypothetical protein
VRHIERIKVKEEREEQQAQLKVQRQEEKESKSAERQFKIEAGQYQNKIMNKFEGETKAQKEVVAVESTVIEEEVEFLTAWSRRVYKLLQ